MWCPRQAKASYWAEGFLVVREVGAVSVWSEGPVGRSAVGRRPWGAVGPGLGGSGWNRGSGSLRKTLLVFSLPRASCPPSGGNSGLSQEWGGHVYFWGTGRDESRRAGVLPRGFSKAALLDVCQAARFTRAAFHCSHLPETQLTPGAHLHPLPCGLP